MKPEDVKIILIKPKSLSPKDKEKLTKKGFTVIETEYPGSGFTVEKQLPAPSQFDSISHKYEYSLCSICGERIYITQDRLSTLKTYKQYFYCSQGHKQAYK